MEKEVIRDIGTPLAIFVVLAIFMGTGYAQVPFAPNLTDGQLKELHNVSKWTISTHKSFKSFIDETGSGGNFNQGFLGGFTAGTWESLIDNEETSDANFVVSGPKGCPAPTGCKVDYTSPSQANVLNLLGFIEIVNVISGCPSSGGGFSDPGTLSFSDQNILSGSSVLDGSSEAGHQAVGTFFIDYSTNPPHAESDIGTSFFLGRRFIHETICHNTSNATAQYNAGGDLSFFFGDPNATNTIDHGGDTQVRVNNGQFIIQGTDNGSENFLACVFSVILTCDKDKFFTVTNTEDSSWIATAPTNEAPPVVTVPKSPLIAEATGQNGASVPFNATANSSGGESLSVICQPISGSIFPLGFTDVTCRATDSAGNVGKASFTIIVQDTTPPHINVPKNIFVNATSPKGANVTYFVTATDLVDGPISLVPCVPASGNIFPIGTTVVKCTATDSHNNEANASFNIIVKGASEQITDLTNYVVSNNLGPGTSLISTLQNAKNLVDSGKTSASCGVLGALINEAKAQSGKKLTTDQAKKIIDDATRIRAVLGC